MVLAYGVLRQSSLLTELGQGDEAQNSKYSNLLSGCSCVVPVRHWKRRAEGALSACQRFRLVPVWQRRYRWGLEGLRVPRASTFGS